MASHLVVRACPPCRIPGDPPGWNASGLTPPSGDAPAWNGACNARLERGSRSLLGAAGTGTGRGPCAAGSPGSNSWPAGWPSGGLPPAAGCAGVGAHHVLQLPPVRHRRRTVSRQAGRATCSGARPAPLAAQPVPSGRLDLLAAVVDTGAGPAPGRRCRGSRRGLDFDGLRRRRADTGRSGGPGRAGRHPLLQAQGPAVGPQGGLAQDDRHGAADGPGHGRRAGGRHRWPNRAPGPGRRREAGLPADLVAAVALC